MLGQIDQIVHVEKDGLRLINIDSRDDVRFCGMMLPSIELPEPIRMGVRAPE